MFDKLIEKISAEKLNVHEIEVVKNNKLIFRHMFHEDIQYPIYSAAKSVTALAVGLLVHEGKLNINAPLANYLDAEALKILHDMQKNAFCALPIKRFLTMSVKGFPFRPQGENRLEFALLSDPDYTAEPEFSYSNISAYLMGIACENAAEMPLFDYLNEKIFSPLGSFPRYQTDPQGKFYGATGIFMTLHELCLIGQLYLNNGKFNGQQLVPEDLITEGTRTHIENSDSGYGYFIWTSGDHYSISGKWGQKCLVYPKKKTDDSLYVGYTRKFGENAYSCGITCTQSLNVHCFIG